MSEFKQTSAPVAERTQSERPLNGKEIVSNAKLLEAGAYFGHKKSKWNPKMKPYIIATKKGTHIMDIQKTKKTLEFAYSIIKKFAARDAQFIFVGTRKQAQATIKDNALRTNSFYVSERWLGGTLTNNKTIFNSVRRMFDLENMAKTNYEGYTKKEGVLFAKELAKLQKNLYGIKSMRSKPQVMIIADPKNDEIAVKEARKLGIKVIGIVDTNCDPNMVDIAIPANDDSIKSVTLIITILADAIASAKGGKQLFAFQNDDAIVLPEELKPEPRVNKSRFGNTRTFNGPRKFERRDNAPRTEATAAAAAPVEKSLVSEAPKYEDMKVADLREIAKNKEIKGFSTMKKNELVEALSK